MENTEQLTEIKGVLDLPILNIKKADISTLVNAAILTVKDGFYDAVQALIIAKKGQELFKQLEEKVRPFAEDHIHLSKGETYKKFNTEIVQRESGVSYDFTACNDDLYDSLVATIESLTEARKMRETFLKGITKPMTIVDEDTGNITTIDPPIRKGKLGLAVSIK